MARYASIFGVSKPFALHPKKKKKERHTEAHIQDCEAKVATMAQAMRAYALNQSYDCCNILEGDMRVVGTAYSMPKVVPERQRNRPKRLRSSSIQTGPLITVNIGHKRPQRMAPSVHGDHLIASSLDSCQYTSPTNNDFNNNGAANGDIVVVVRASPAIARDVVVDVLLRLFHLQLSSTIAPLILISA